jgi:hypothetical protein
MGPNLQGEILTWSARKYSVDWHNADLSFLALQALHMLFLANAVRQIAYIGPNLHGGILAWSARKYSIGWHNGDLFSCTAGLTRAFSSKCSAANSVLEDLVCKGEFLHGLHRKFSAANSVYRT